MLQLSTERGVGLIVGLILGIVAYFLVVWALPLLSQGTWIYT